MTVYLAKFVGVYALLAGAWLYFRRDAAVALVDRITHDPVIESFVGVLRAAAGLAIIIAHPYWDNWLAALISVLAWIGLASGLSTMFLPPGTLRRITDRVRFKDHLPLYAAVSSTLGAALVLGGFIE
ncbi:MAG: hypothetical protein CTY15_03325 [Methylocystis sp.]|nr:MAG: hypothetical protein CTY15_03325 [Methylocystis sp.]